MNLGWGLVSILLVIALMVLAKGFFSGMPFSRRPNGKSDDGFPSGHTAVAAAVATVALLMGFSWKLVAFLVLIAVIVSWQRVASRAHSESQVAAGAALGIGVPLLVWMASR